MEKRGKYFEDIKKITDEEREELYDYFRQKGEDPDELIERAKEFIRKVEAELMKSQPGNEFIQYKDLQSKEEKKE